MRCSELIIVGHCHDEASAILGLGLACSQPPTLSHGCDLERQIRSHLQHSARLLRVGSDCGANRKCCSSFRAFVRAPHPSEVVLVWLHLFHGRCAASACVPRPQRRSHAGQPWIRGSHHGFDRCIRHTVPQHGPQTRQCPTRCCRGRSSPCGLGSHLNASVRLIQTRSPLAKIYRSKRRASQLCSHCAQLHLTPTHSSLRQPKFAFPLTLG